jgi:catechol 2,3-dioxygenase-like lactoylglutathione lyase family enzyme
MTRPANPSQQDPTQQAAWRFDHFNVSMGHAKALSALFQGVMGLAPGYRPPFPFPGLWLYEGEQAFVHAVDDPTLSPASGELRFGHIAFRSDQPATQVIERVHASGLPLRVAHVPQEHTVQVFVQLPGGLVVELDLPDDGAATSYTYTAAQASPGAKDF